MGVRLAETARASRVSMEQEVSMDGPEREQELWQQVAASGQPDEKRRKGMREALERYYLARGLQHGGAGSSGGDEPVSRIDPIERSRRTG